MMPLGAAGGCQISRTDVVLTSGNRMPMGGPGTGGDRAEAGDTAAAAQPLDQPGSGRAARRVAGEGVTLLAGLLRSVGLCLAPCPHTGREDAISEVYALLGRN